VTNCSLRCIALQKLKQTTSNAEVRAKAAGALWLLETSPKRKVAEFSSQPSAAGLCSNHFKLLQRILLAVKMPQRYLSYQTKFSLLMV